MKTLLFASCVVAAVLLAAQCEAKKSVQLTEEDVGYCTKSKRGEAHITEWRNTTVDINYGADVKVVPGRSESFARGHPAGGRTLQALQREGREAEAQEAEEQEGAARRRRTNRRPPPPPVVHHRRPPARRR
ncbi:hypothetical protein M3Y99_00674700 [Aphelenchoides fujianensis]|nr:hypothetical protein M3Y99_00674700 [Aphelenchoides fujianensis]